MARLIAAHLPLRFAQDPEARRHRRQREFMAHEQRAAKADAAHPQHHGAVSLTPAQSWYTPHRSVSDATGA